MSDQFSRRRFVTQTLLASTATSTVLGRAADAPAPAAVSPGAKNTLPMGALGRLRVSRLISGGNLISGWAHSRDLSYVASLMRAYNTEEKVMDTLQLLEEHGVNTIIADPRKKPMDIFARYWKERGGKIQWIAEGHPDVDDWKTNLKQSIDFGAAAVYIQGVKSDQFHKQGRLELLGKCVEFIKQQGVPAGIGAHKLEVVKEAEQQQYGAEFYVKTLHHDRYWSARRPDQNEEVIDNTADNYWDKEPNHTVAFMRQVRKPWIAFKVLAAGAIRPESGFRYAFENGADFICVGMFDFQVAQNVKIAKELIQVFAQRERPWIA